MVPELGISELTRGSRRAPLESTLNENPLGTRAEDNERSTGLFMPEQGMAF
jgi:hypothetical protein